MAPSASPPRGVWVAAGFFAVGSVLQLGLAIWELPRPVAFWPVWEGVGRSLLHGLVAAGLWQRLAFCRSIAMVYCLAALVTHGVALGLALAAAPLRFPDSLVVMSLYEVPSCALLLPYLRSTPASLLFNRRIFGRGHS